MVSIQIFPFFVVIFSCINFVESTGIDREISLLLQREQTIKFLLQNYKNLKLDASLVFRGIHANLLKNYENIGIMDPYTHYNMYPYGRVDDLKKHFQVAFERDLKEIIQIGQNEARDYVGKHFLIAYVETFEHLAKTLNDSNEFSERAKELAQKMAEKLQNLEANNSDGPVESMNFEKELKKLKKIKHNMKELDKISTKNIFAEIREEEKEDENHQETNQSELDAEAVTYQIYDLRSFENVFQKTDEQFEMMKNWAIKNNGLPKEQAKFFAAMELCLMMGEQLQTIAENILDKERIVPVLEKVTNEMNELNGEMVENLGIEGSIQYFEKFRTFYWEFEKLTSKKTFLTSYIEKLKKHMGIVEKFKNDIYFNKYAYLMRKLIGQMAKIIAEIQAEHLLVKGVRNIRNSFDVLREMQKKIMKENEGQRRYQQ